MFSSTTNRWSALFFLIAILISVLAMQGTCVAETETNMQSADHSSDIENRLKLMERQINMLSSELGRSRTVYNILIEAKQLASDAWDIAVEARTIALRAEEKADRLQREKDR